MNIHVVCPSFRKKCGIGEYAKYLSNEFKKTGLDVYEHRRVVDVVRSGRLNLNSFIIVNHGPGLYDGFNPELSEGEATIEFVRLLKLYKKTYGCEVLIYLHSLLDSDNKVMYGRQMAIIRSGLRVATTIKSAALKFGLEYIDHGIQDVSISIADVNRLHSSECPKIGFFGFFQYGGKDFDALISLVKAVKGKLVGSVAAKEKWEFEKLELILSDAGIPHDVLTGWVDDDILARKLKSADFYYLPQKDYDHWNNSGTARFVLNFGKPVLLPPHQPFLDMWPYVIFAEAHDLPKLIAYLRGSDEYKNACKRSRVAVAEIPMASTASSILTISVAGDFKPYDAPDIKYRNHRFYSSYLASLNLGVNLEQSLDLYCGVPQGGYAKLTSYEISEFFVGGADDVLYKIYEFLEIGTPHFDEYREIMALKSGSIYEDVRADKIILTALLYKLYLIYVRCVNGEGQVRKHLTHKGEQVTPGLILDHFSEIVDCIYSLGKQVNRVDDSDSIKNIHLSASVAGFNIFYLILGSNEYLNEFFRYYFSIDVDFGMTHQMQLRERLDHFFDVLDEVNFDVFNNLLCDALVVPEVEPLRLKYSHSDFLCFAGDNFLINLVRCAFKRNIYPSEFVFLNEILCKHGRRQLMLMLVGCDLSKVSICHGDDYFDREWIDDGFSNNMNTLIQDFRSPIMGGWDARNIYLMLKRANDRFWLKIKRDVDGLGYGY